MKPIAAAFGTLLVALVVVTIIGGFNLGWNRIASPIQEQTRTLTYEQSASRQEGVESQISGYCLNMRTAKVAADKRAFASFITSVIASYQGNVSTDTRTCVSEANAIMSEPSGL